MWAATTGQVEIIDMLLGAGADLEAADARGSTALMLALGKPDSLQALLAAGADTEHKDGRGFTALMSAAWTGRVSAARHLLEHGARLDVRDGKTGRTALMWAALKGHAGFVKMLLDAGADPTLQDSSGHTALDLARQAHRNKVVELLNALDAGMERAEGTAPAAR
jgi:ankyrin repeat protein